MARSSALAKLVLAQQKQTVRVPHGDRRSIAAVIDEVLTLGDNSEDRRDGKFHPSDLSKDFCPRAWCLYNFHPDGYRVKEGDINPRGQRIFDNGHHLHARLQGYLARKAGLLFGSWERVIGLEAGGTLKTERRADSFRPEGEGWVYTEVKLSHPLDNIRGSTDGILLLDGYKDVVEIKSIRSDMFRWLAERPHLAHEVQVDIYFHCLEARRQQLLRAGVPLTRDRAVWEFATRPFDGVWVLYENKDTQELKPFYIPYDADRVAARLADLRPRMERALEYQNTKVLPTCTCPDRKRSKLCKTLP